MSKSVNEHQMDDVHRAFDRLLIQLILFGQDKLGLDIIEISAIVGRTVGSAAACADDTLSHDPEWVQQMEELSREHNVPVTGTPCLETLKTNIEHYYALHKNGHDVARKQGTEFLHDVCESHKEGGK